MELVVNCGGLGCHNPAELVARIVINGIALVIPTCPSCCGGAVSISADSGAVPVAVA